MGAADQGVQSAGRWQVSPRTLCFVRCEGAVLLMKRSPDRRIFPNRYNGLGGHVERDEDVYASVAREIEEESGLIVRDLRLRGIHHIDAGADSGILIFVFTAQGDRNTPLRQTDEGTLEWVDIDGIGTLDLVDDVAEILPRALSMGPTALPYFAHVSYDDGDRIVIRYA